jgi:hypothetical protein
VWQHTIDKATGDVYTQRVNSAGDVHWITDGIAR